MMVQCRQSNAQANPLLRVSAETNFRNLSPNKIDEAFELAKECFANAEIPITEIQYWSNFFVVVLENGQTDFTKVPNTVGQCYCY